MNILIRFEKIILFFPSCKRWSVLIERMHARTASFIWKTWTPRTLDGVPKWQGRVVNTRQITEKILILQRSNLCALWSVWVGTPAGGGVAPVFSACTRTSAALYRQSRQRSSYCLLSIYWCICTCSLRCGNCTQRFHRSRLHFDELNPPWRRQQTKTRTAGTYSFLNSPYLSLLFLIVSSFCSLVTVWLCYVWKFYNLLGIVC